MSHPQRCLLPLRNELKYAFQMQLKPIRHANETRGKTNANIQIQVSLALSVLRRNTLYGKDVRLEQLDNGVI